mmetsp:Transcript_91576/g.243269  ORF Transcript_91576/g.243269 Transcript_91576/m.243269 type:complete len:211 (-) Transcript_91576:131-763(-)
MPDHPAEDEEHKDVGGRNAKNCGAERRRQAKAHEGERGAKRLQGSRGVGQDGLPCGGRDDKEGEAQRQHRQLDQQRPAVLVVPSEPAPLVRVKELDATLQLCSSPLRARDRVGEADLQLCVLRRAALLQRKDRCRLRARHSSPEPHQVALELQIHSAKSGTTSWSPHGCAYGGRLLRDTVGLLLLLGGLVIIDTLEARGHAEGCQEGRYE